MKAAASAPVPAPVRAFASILETIGNTPLVRLQLPGVPERVELWAKCEWFNPGGSVKDRTALSLVTEGERTGALRPGRMGIMFGVRPASGRWPMAANPGPSSPTLARVPATSRTSRR